MKTVRTEEELGEALGANEDSILVEGDLARKVFRIKATGKVAWCIAIGAIGVAVALVIASAGVGAPAAAGAAPVAIGILGMPTVITCIVIAVSSGGVAVLNKLRSYTLIEKDNGTVVLIKPMSRMK